MNIAEKITRAKADYDAVYEAGKKSQYDAFWDDFQDFGNRKSYLYAFRAWTDKLFCPKYDIICGETARGMFASCKITDLKGNLEKCGVTLDTSGATSMVEILAYSKNLTRVPTISGASASEIQYLFCNDYALIEVEKLILKADGSQSLNAAFARCDELVTLIIEGVIGKSDLDLHWSTKLSKASITSVINALSTTTSGLSVTLSKTAVNTAFGSTESAEWKSLIATKSNWTISLA